ncbi:hypothetical protein [Nonomuraea typhae]|uniref:Uncharacterized protein n=1 Tax=Nonomuraea typhae TaxID=2603600 RepID=A0ABW7ZBQ0_9ACTN
MLTPSASWANVRSSVTSVDPAAQEFQVLGQDAFNAPPQVRLTGPLGYELLWYGVANLTHAHPGRTAKAGIRPVSAR